MQDIYEEEYKDPEKRLKEYLADCNRLLQNSTTTSSDDYHLPNVGPIHHYNPNSQNNAEDVFEAIEDSLRR